MISDGKEEGKQGQVHLGPGDPYCTANVDYYDSIAVLVAVITVPSVCRIVKYSYGFL